jgi:peroxiredoxin Q/BCP
VVGISVDPWDQQLIFDEANHLNLMLLSDPERSVASQFGVKRMGRLPNKRRTFVVGTDRRVLAMITSESNMGKHADGALATLQELR